MNAGKKVKVSETTPSPNCGQQHSHLLHQRLLWKQVCHKPTLRSVLSTGHTQGMPSEHLILSAARPGSLGESGGVEEALSLL